MVGRTVRLDISVTQTTVEDAALTNDITKRGILKWASTIFDPLGLI